MAKKTKMQEVEGKLSNSLVLNRYILSLFGTTSLEGLSEHLKDPGLEGWDENNVSHFHRVLVDRMFGGSELTEDLLLAYDENIFRHTQAISEKRSQPNVGSISSISVCFSRRYTLTSISEISKSYLPI